MMFVSGLLICLMQRQMVGWTLRLALMDWIPDPGWLRHAARGPLPQRPLTCSKRDKKWKLSYVRGRCILGKMLPGVNVQYRQAIANMQGT